jgi:hypothetical protein
VTAALHQPPGRYEAVIPCQAGVIERVVVGHPIFLADNRRRVSLFHELEVHHQATGSAVTIDEWLDFDESGMQLRCALNDAHVRGSLVPANELMHFVVNVK